MVLVLFLLVGMTSVFAQKHVSVSGRITDELNEPMIGVSVLEKGTTNGVITDLDGNLDIISERGFHYCLFVYRVCDPGKESRCRYYEYYTEGR